MWQDIGKNERRERYQFLRILIETALCKGIFVFFILFCIFFSSSVSVRALSDPEKSLAHTIVVTATVPLTPEFSFIIRKNSSIVSNKNIFLIGEEAIFSTYIVGWKNAPLVSHLIKMRITNKNSQEFVFSRETDRNGLATFSVPVTPEWLGENKVEIIDMTYGDPLTILETKTINVYEQKTNDEKYTKIAQEIGSHILRTVVTLYP